MMMDFILCCVPNANRLRWDDVIRKAAKDASGRHLIVIDGVSISQCELDRIGKLHGITRQKVMFTLLCLAKYKNVARPNNNGWINFDASFIFKTANTSLTSRAGMLLLHELAQLEYISYSRRVDSLSLQIDMIDDAEDPVATITDFRNLGNQYLRLIGHTDFIECAECGAVVRRNGRRQRYCKACAREVNQRKQLWRNRTAAFGA